MPILHRVRISKHKRKKIFIQRKRVYEKFIGLKTFKIVLHRECSSHRGTPKVNKKVTKRAVIKKPLRRVHIKFPNFRTLPPNQRRQEVMDARVDLINFKAAKNESLQLPKKEEKFQAYIPQDIWAKMTSEQRRAHIKKRIDRAMNRRIKRVSKYAFYNRKFRPALHHIGFRRRRLYRKNLIKLAAMQSSRSEPVPFTKEKFAEISLSRVRTVLSSGNKIRKKNTLFKNLTYTSLMPKIIGLTTEKLCYAKN